LTVFYLIILGMISTFSIGVDYAFGASVSIPQGTAVPGCDETNECFIPYEFSILVGDQVTWTNDDPAAHTVTAGSQADGPSGFFDSNLLLKGTTFSYYFNEAGIYPYFCKVHPWMNGIVKVGYHLYLPPSLELDTGPSDQSIQK
jgi:plastocyanin